MRVLLQAAAIAVMASAMLPVTALAGSPDMSSPAARARDRAIIRQLNRNEIARVRRRDAAYAEGWRAWREGGANAQRQRDHQRALADYARRRAQHDRDMAAWRRAVAACRAGDYSACD